MSNLPTSPSPVRVTDGNISSAGEDVQGKEIAAWEEVLTSMHDHWSWMLGPSWWQERTSFCKLFSDIHTSIVREHVHIYIHKILKRYSLANQAFFLFITTSGDFLTSGH